jgi:hypothetical protein
LGNTRAELPVNDKNIQILPDGSKTLSAQLTADSWYWGPYKTEAMVRYGGSDGQQKVVTDTHWFWVVPPIPTVIGFILLLALFVGIPLGLRWQRRRIERELREDGDF